jgi:hypothetical protein
MTSRRETTPRARHYAPTAKRYNDSGVTCASSHGQKMRRARTLRTCDRRTTASTAHNRAPTLNRRRHRALAARGRRADAAPQETRAVGPQPGATAGNRPLPAFRDRTRVPPTSSDWLGDDIAGAWRQISQMLVAARRLEALNERRRILGVSPELLIVCDCVRRVIEDYGNH